MQEKIDGIKVIISRNKTIVVDVNNLVIPDGSRANQLKFSGIGEGKYAEYNYGKRIKHRAKKIRELCNNSFDAENCMFVTLTFDANLSPDKDFTNLTTAHEEFKKFIKRVNERYSDFKYIATFSKQLNCNRWHYHLICNFDDSVTTRDIRLLWENGYVSKSEITTYLSFKNHVNYLIKNARESAGELRGRKGYLTSKNVERDIIIRSWRPEQAEDFEEVAGDIMGNGVCLLYKFCKEYNEMPPKDDGTLTDEEKVERINAYEERKRFYNENAPSYTYFSATTKYPNEFEPLVLATPKPKKPPDSK